MTEWERVTEAMQKFANACGEFSSAFCDWATATVKAFVETLDSETIVKAAAYTKAEKEHQGWVHKAIHSKKKRIRKKYHDRIMRQYRRNHGRF